MTYEGQRRDQALPHFSGQKFSAGRRQARSFLASTGRGLRSPYCLPLCLILLAGSSSFLLPKVVQLYKDGAFRRAGSKSSEILAGSTESSETPQKPFAMKAGEVEPFDINEIDVKDCKPMEQYLLQNRLVDLDKTLRAMKEEKKQAVAAGNDKLVEMMRIHSQQGNLEAITTSERTRIMRLLRYICFSARAFVPVVLTHSSGSPRNRTCSLLFGTNGYTQQVPQ